MATETTMSTSTPGPWTTDTDKRFRAMSTEQLPEAIGVRGPNDMFVACAFDFNRTDRDAEVEANARLIAAAPELLAACAALKTQLASVLWCDQEGIGTPLGPMVRATFEKCLEMAAEAISKAEGR